MRIHTANRIFLGIYVVGFLSFLLPYVPRDVIAYADLIFWLSISPVFNNITLGLLLIVPASLVVLAWKNRGKERGAPLAIATTYLVLYGLWLLVPGGSTPLDDGSFGFKSAIPFLVLPGITTIWLLTVKWLNRTSLPSTVIIMAEWLNRANRDIM